MVVRPEPGRSEKYTVRMLAGNRIPGLLPFQEKSVNGEKKYYYDITSRQPLGRILERRNIKAAELRTVFYDLLFTLRQMERYLLDENQICLEPEAIYLEPDSFRCGFCLIPGNYADFESAFRELTRYFLNHVNHHDSEAVVLAFSIFQECQKVNFGMEDMIRCLEQFGENPEQDPKQDPAPAEPVSGFSEKLFQPLEEPGPEKEKRMETEDERIPETMLRSLKTGLLPLKIAILLLMIGLPAAAVLFRGIEELAVRWPMFAGSEGILVMLFLLIHGRDLAAEEKETMTITGKEDLETENMTAAGEIGEWLRELPELCSDCEHDRKEWDNETEEEEIQTILLTDNPVNREGRQLVPLNGGPPIRISYMPFLIGKNRELSDFCLDFPGISRLHVKIEETEGGYTITDLNSTNGTLVDGRILNANETCALNPGNEISIASLRYRFL